jgi:hypothetical protein
MTRLVSMIVAVIAAASFAGASSAGDASFPPKSKAACENHGGTWDGATRQCR